MTSSITVWNSTSDRLPTSASSKCLVFTVHNHHLARWIASEGKWVNELGNEVIGVTHWMELTTP